MDCDFEIDDRVECILDRPDNNDDIVVGCTGTVCHFDMYDGCIGVCWDHEISGGHDCCTRCENGHGWYVKPKYIRVIEIEDFEVDEEMLDSFFSELVVQKARRLNGR